MHVLRELRRRCARRTLSQLRRRAPAASAAAGGDALELAAVDDTRPEIRGVSAARVSRNRSRLEAPLLRGLPPIENPAARVLVLGSMPGAASLAAGRYYAHPRNLFWPLMGELLGFDPALPYARRIAALKRARIALWDVIGACRRAGSLDARIDSASIVVNDFPGFLARHPRLTLIGFNGAAAASSWRRFVTGGVAGRELRYVTLPSSSPANASVAMSVKREAWRVVLDAARAI